MINPSGGSSASVSGNGTLAIPNTIKINGAGSSLPVTQFAWGGIGSSSFSGTLIIPNSVEIVRDGPLSGITNATGLQFEDGGTSPLSFTSSGGSYFVDFGNNNSASIGTVEFPARLDYIANSAFCGSYFDNIVFNDGPYPLTINNGAFCSMPYLTGTVNFPSNTTELSGTIFNNTPITGISFNDGGSYPLTITNTAFTGATTLIGTTINFPSNTTRIDNQAFIRTGIYGVSFTDGGDFPLSIENAAFACNRIEGTVIFPSNLVSLGSTSFGGEYDCGTNYPNNSGLDTVIFTNPGGNSLTGVSDSAFRPGVSFINACSTGQNPETAIIEFLGPDGVTPIETTNDFGCGAYTNGPSAGVIDTVFGYRFNGWHLMQDLSDPALDFPWTPFANAVTVDDLLAYGDWIPYLQPPAGWQQGDPYPQQPEGWEQGDDWPYDPRIMPPPSWWTPGDPWPNPDGSRPGGSDVPDTDGDNGSDVAVPDTGLFGGIGGGAVGTASGIALAAISAVVLGAVLIGRKVLKKSKK